MKRIDFFVIISASIHFISIMMVRLQALFSSSFEFEDIDYKVFTDAASLVFKGCSPYERETYRYTPLLAYLLVPNMFFRDFGKFLFSVSTIACGIVCFKILKEKGYSEEEAANKVGLIWLLNPLIVSISVRGSSDSFVSLLVILSFYFLLKEKIFLFSLFFSLSVHFKVYPIIYVLSFTLFLFKRKGFLLFFLLSPLLFLSLFLIFFFKYGAVFCQETYFYHLTRIDFRHNLSPYFYSLYIEKNCFLSKSSLIIQFLLIVLFSFKYAKKDILFCCFIQTLSFVSFNKVFTTQYLVWYFIFLPFVDFNIFLLFPFLSILVWNYFAYQLEFNGKSFFTEVWLCSLLIFIWNVSLICSYIKRKSLKQII